MDGFYAEFIVNLLSQVADVYVHDVGIARELVAPYIAEQLVTRDELLSNVWGYEFAGDTNIVDVYIRYLRQKIDDKFGVKTIHTIRAVGYMFRYE